MNNTRGNWIIVIIHFPYHFSIPWLFQVFQKSGHPEESLAQTGVVQGDTLIHGLRFWPCESVIIQFFSGGP